MRTNLKAILLLVVLIFLFLILSSAADHSDSVQEGRKEQIFLKLAHARDMDSRVEDMMFCQFIN